MFKVSDHCELKRNAYSSPDSYKFGEEMRNSLCKNLRKCLRMKKFLTTEVHLCMDENYDFHFYTHNCVYS